ncbi:MAG: regulatory protein RecX [Candidatus Omnitrophota bacterium]
MEKDKEKAKRYCLRLLSHGSRTRHEIRERLRRKGYDEKVIDALSADLEKGSLLDDVSFAKEWIEYRLRTSPRAKGVLKDELIKKGISEDIIIAVFIERSDDLKDEKIAEGLMQSESSRLKGISTGDKKIKLFRKLLARGFDQETAEDLVERFLTDLQSGQ